MKVTEFRHIALLVRDLAKSELFYGEVLGLSKVDRSLKFPGIWYQINNVQIHLIESPVPNQMVDHSKWGRNQHLALGVENLMAAKERLIDFGCKIQMSASGRAALFTTDPDDNIIEITE